MQVDTPDITPHLYGNTVLAGGTTLMRGFQNRLTHEVEASLSHTAWAEGFRVCASSDRQYSAWIGGSILASLPTFQDFWVSRADWEENGSITVLRNCF